MFGRKKKENTPEERPAPSRQSRAGLYAMCGLYLGYLLFQLLDPYFTPGAPRPTALMLALGVTILGGGAAALLYLAWRIYWTPAPRDPEENALPEEAGTEETGTEETGEDKET